jgi:hypothetical protein
MHAKQVPIQVNVAANNVYLNRLDRKWNFSSSCLQSESVFKILRNPQRSARDEIATIVVCWISFISRGASPLLALSLTRFSPFPSRCHFRKEGCEGMDIKWLFYTYGARRESSLLRLKQGCPSVTLRLIFTPYPNHFQYFVSAVVLHLFCVILQSLNETNTEQGAQRSLLAIVYIFETILLLEYGKVCEFL